MTSSLHLPRGLSRRNLLGLGVAGAGALGLAACGGPEVGGGGSGAEEADVDFAGVEPATLDEAQKHRLLDDIDHDLRRARSALPGLPADSRRAVRAAYALFAALAARIRVTDASVLRTRRVSLPAPAKLRIVSRSLYAGVP